MGREHYEQRLFRIFAQVGYSPVRILTVTPEEMVKIPGITVPNIRLTYRRDWRTRYIKYRVAER